MKLSPLRLLEPILPKRSRVQWDQKDRSFRIAVKDGPKGRYEVLYHLRFASRGAALEHLGWRADF